MEFSVIVPVLSVQITVVLPKVSTILLLLMIIPSRMSFHAPSAIKVVNATGISSGNTDIANVSPLSKLATKLPLSIKLYIHTNKKMSIPTMAIAFTNFWICTCNGEISSLIFFIDSPIFPTRVSLPISVTSNTARPETVTVPL